MAKKPKLRKDGKPDGRSLKTNKGKKLGPSTGIKADGTADRRVGSKFWEARASHGRPALYDDPQKLWADCVEYFEWVEANPLMTAELVKYQGEARVVEVPKMRAMTISGLCLFLQIDQKTWFNYCKRDEFFQVTSRATEHIYNQKFSGAAAELLNPNIIARDLGLSDKQDIKASVITVLEGDDDL